MTAGNKGKLSYYRNMYGKMLSLFEFESGEDNDGTKIKEMVMAFKNDLAEAETNLVENVKGEDREMKTISKEILCSNFNDSSCKVWPFTKSNENKVKLLCCHIPFDNSWF